MTNLSAIGAIFDWDGVIVDSSAAHEESWNLLAAEEKRTLPPGHFKAGFGRKNQVIIPNILKWTEAADAAAIARIGARKEELYREILKTTGISALPGVRELLEGLRAAGIPCVVGSSTPRLNIEHVMTLAKLHGFFADIVSAEDVSHGKPHPEVFLKAAAKINRTPANCVVFEDAFVGLEAARAGGFKSIGVGTTNSVESLKGHCDRAVHRLDELTSKDIIRLAGNNMSAIHLILKNDPGKPPIERVKGRENIYRSGYWHISDDTANTLIGSKIYFHRQQSAPSFYGGRIIAIAKMDEGEYAGRIIFTFEYEDSCRGITTLPEGWSREMKII